MGQVVYNKVVLKKLLKSLVVKIEYKLVKKLIREKPDLKIVGVVGSVGKTGTKKAIATVLDQKYSVAWQDGTYNDITTVPLIFFGLKMPKLTSVFGWLSTFHKMKKQIKNYSHDVVVLELGMDMPGEIEEFGKYLKLDIAVVTHISEEHMEYFEDLDAIAVEELSVQNYSDILVVEKACYEKFKHLIQKDVIVFGHEQPADAYFVSAGRNLNIFLSEQVLACQTNIHGLHQVNTLVAAALVGQRLGLSPDQIENGVSSVLPVPGRMQILKGKDGSMIIDDTYNSSPDAAIGALDYLDSLDSNAKIAVLGNMNELGKFSPDLHKRVAEVAAQKNIDEYITLGPDANKYFATILQSSSKKVQVFTDPYAIGEYLKSKNLSNTAILFKGSQFGVYLEEAIKYILADKSDEQNLVRQSGDWLSKKKKASFKV